MNGADEWMRQYPPGVTPPPPPLRGVGLYDGDYADGAPWGPIPVVADTGYLIHHVLRSAHPPPGATTQYPGTLRPGNNWSPLPGVSYAPPSAATKFTRSATCAHNFSK